MKGLTKEVIRRVVGPEEFIVVYLRDIQGMLGNISGNGIKLIQLMWLDSEFPDRSPLRSEGLAGNIVKTTKDYKELWAKDLKISISALNNLITVLIKNKILIEYASPVYFLDPNKFFKGSVVQREKALRVIYKYEITGDGK